MIIDFKAYKSKKLENQRVNHWKLDALRLMNKIKNADGSTTEGKNEINHDFLQLLSIFLPKEMPDFQGRFGLFLENIESDSK